MEARIILLRCAHDRLSELFTATVLPDGSPVVSGLDQSRPVVFKLDAHDGSTVWEWRARYGGRDAVTGAVADGNGSIFVAGRYSADLHPPGMELADLKNKPNLSELLRPRFAVTKLDADGKSLWRREGGMFIAVGRDGSTAVSGGKTGDGSLMKLDADGRLLWKWELERDDDCYFHESAVAITDDDGVVLAGTTLCRSEDGTYGVDRIHHAVAAEDGSVILSGSTSEDPFDKASHGHDVSIAVKIDADGTEVWRWKGRSDDWRHAPVLAMDGEGSLLMGGYKTRIGSSSSKGRFDLVVIKLNASTGTEEDWRWQESTAASGELRAMAAGPNGTVVLAGCATGSFGRKAERRVREAAALMLDSSLPSPKPSAMRMDFDVDGSTAFILVYAVLGALVIVAGIVKMARESSRSRKKEKEMRALRNGTAVASTEGGPIPVAAPVERAGDIYGADGPGRRGQNGSLRRFIPIAVAYHNSQVVREDDEASPDAPIVRAYSAALTDSSTPRADVVRI